MKKRHNYGSLLIDFQTRKVIDLILYRSQTEVSEWLQKFPSLSYIIRDGAQSFRNAIFDAFPDVIQISDRFHVLKSLTDHAMKAKGLSSIPTVIYKPVRTRTSLCSFCASLSICTYLSFNSG
ncbi:transposase [Lactococcus petauri]|uniref:Transposase IS204/IS1001/IS1096/IS1165 DDE domain-containing protein n=1 Tax=Lactococcus petauri TaxID=1940789 RepID=A0A252CAE4_9LACT|nr:hypothetical protein BZZ03_11255 [Lactococcus petauri]